MIGQITRLATFTLILGFLLSCVTTPPQAMENIKRANEIQDIRITEGPSHTTIEVEAEEAMLYTTFQLTDPNRLIIDIADISLGVFDQEVHLRNGPILAIRPVSGGGGNVVRLEIRLAEGVQANVGGAGANLVVAAAEVGRIKSKFVFFEDEANLPPKVLEETVSSEATDLENSGAKVDLPLAVEQFDELVVDNIPQEHALEEVADLGSSDETAENNAVKADLSTTSTDEIPEILIEQVATVEQGVAVLPGKTPVASSMLPVELFMSESSALPPLAPLPLRAEENTEPEPPSEKVMEEVLAEVGEVSPEFIKNTLEDPDSSIVDGGMEEMVFTETPPLESVFAEVPVLDEKEDLIPELAEEEPLPDAKWMSKIYFEKDEHLRLIIKGDGTLHPFVFRVDKKRIAIDLPGVRTNLKRLKVLAGDPLVTQVRIGRHPKKIRLVIDLKSNVMYSWQQNRDHLEITFTDPFAPMGQTNLMKVDTGLPPVSPTDPITHLPPPLFSKTGKVLTDSGDPNVALRKVATQAEGKEKNSSPKSVLTPMDFSTKEEQEKHLRKRIFLRQRREKKIEQGKNLFVQKRKVEEVLIDSPKPKYIGKKISLDFQGAEITNVIRLIADVSHLNFVMGEDVKGKISLKLANVPWDQALDIILEMNSLGKVQQGNIIRITTLVNLAKQRDEIMRAKETEVSSADLVTRVIYVNYGKADEAKILLEKLLSPRGEIMVDKRTNAMVVKDIEENLEQIERLTAKLDTKTPQVLIEARIAEVKPSFKKSLGIQWGADFKTTRGGNIIGLGNAASGSAFNGGTPDFAVNLPASNNLGGLGFTFGRFTQSPFTLDLRLSAGEVMETTRIVSTPKIMVLDNHEALIEQGESIPFQTSSSNAGTKTQFIDANMTLKVTPHISPDGGILLNVHLTKNEPALITEAGAPGPRIFKKEITTKILLMDGETVVIGGIYESKSSKVESGIPWLKDLPIIGWLFRNESSSKSISELLVFITPTIMD